MSRLDSFIRRLSAQRDILDHIADEVAELEGPIFELGLGNGRTFDHLREHFPNRRIVAFDRKLAAYSSSTPPPEDLVLGEIRTTTQDFFGMGGALVHADIGTGYDEIDAVTVTWLPEVAARLLDPGGLVASGLPLDHPDLIPLPLPESVPEERYFLYRRG